MKSIDSVAVFIFAIVIKKLDGDNYTLREDYFFRNVINSTNEGKLEYVFWETNLIL